MARRDEQRRRWSAVGLVVAATTLPVCAETASAPPDEFESTLAPSAQRLEPPEVPAASPRPMPGPNRARGHAALLENGKCIECHEQEAEEWRGSRHRAAFENEAFRAALVVEPAVSAPFCRGCHAPEADPSEVPSPTEAALGVGCVTCHVAEQGVVLSPGHVDGEDAPTAAMPHAVRRSPEFGHTGACAACHEFRFPFATGDHDEAFMQTTIREHRRSKAADQSCASCHMPKRAGGRSHAFDVRDPQWLRAALEVVVSGTERGSIVITIAQKHPGHAFPTGDLFRRVEVGAAITSASGQVLASGREHMTRHLELQPGRAGRVLRQDDRLFFESAEVELTFPLTVRSTSDTLRWWVDYQRVAQTFDGHDPQAAEIESQVPLFRGTCRVEKAKRPTGFVLTSCQETKIHDKN